MKNICYIHVCNINLGLQILKSMIDYIKNSNLYNLLESINICLVGNTSIFIIENLKKYDKKINFCFYNPNPKLYEYPCLNCLWELSKDTNCNILYMHTKGANSLNDDHENEWRKYLLYFMVDKFQDCLKKINYFGYDTVGCDMIKNVHYAGNFWWAKSSYIKTLNCPLKYLNNLEFYNKISNNIYKVNRYYAENWLLSNKEVKSYNLISLNLNNLNFKQKKINLSDYRDGNNPQILYLNNLRKLNLISKKQYSDLVNKINKCNSNDTINLTT